MGLCFLLHTSPTAVLPASTTTYLIMHNPKCQVTSLAGSNLSSMLLLSGVAEGSSEIFNATLQHPRVCSSQPCSHPNPKPHHHGTSCPSSLARFLPLLVRVPFCAEQMGTSCLGTATLPSPRPCGKMHHRSREPSLPTL